MKQPQSSEHHEPRHEPNQLVVDDRALDSVDDTLARERIGTELGVRVGPFRVVHLVPLQDWAGTDLVEDALAALASAQIDGDPVAEPNYIYGCPQMRGGQFVPPDPLSARHVAFRPSPFGAGVRVRVLDTIYVAPPVLASVVPTVGGTEDLRDRVTGELAPAGGHSAFVIGQILRAAPGADVTPIEVLSGQGEGSDVQVATALNQISTETDAPHIVNLSLGGYTVGDKLPNVLEYALGRLQAEAGTVIVAAAGNNDSDRPWFPAGREPLTVAVGAVVRVGSKWARAAYSDYGEWVDFCAPGLLNGPFPVWNDQPQPYAGWAGWSGTSFSAPLVAGALAALMSMQGGEKDAEAAVDLLRDQSPPAPADFPQAKVVNPPLLWAH